MSEKDLKKIRENLYHQIQEVSKALRKANQEEQIMFEVAGLESKLKGLKEDLVRCSLGDLPRLTLLSTGGMSAQDRRHQRGKESL